MSFHGNVLIQGQAITAGLPAYQSSINKLHSEATPVTLPFIDLLGRNIQLWKYKGHLIASIVEDLRLSFLPGTNVWNALQQDERGLQLLARLETFGLKKWAFAYQKEQKRLTVWPFLIAEAGNDGKSHEQTKINNHKTHLTYRDLNAARREEKGEVVAVRKDGKPFDHVDEVRNSQKGLKDVIVRLQNKLNGDLPPQEKARVQKELSEASKLLDHSEKFLKSLPLRRTPGGKQFQSDLQQTRLTESYNSSHRNNPVPQKGGTGGDIGGVACSTEYIEGLFDSPSSLFEQQHYFCFPALEDGNPPFSQEELKQILRELAIGVYTEGAFPFFSLHFREKNSDLFPVIHPVYKNTLVGRVISMLDDQMKGYLNGGTYDDAFVDAWYQRPDWNNRSEVALRHLIDFASYCKTHLEGQDQMYIPLRDLAKGLNRVFAEEGLDILSLNGRRAIQQLLERTGLVTQEESPILATFEGFKNSFRIISNLQKVRKEGPVFIIDGDFEVKYTIEPSHEYKSEMEQYIRKNGVPPPSYQAMVASYEMMAERIHDHMVKLPISKKYFAMLGVITFFASYFSTLKKHRKIPVLPALERPPIKGCPPLFPHLPINVTRTEKIQINVHDVLKGSIRGKRESIAKFFKEGLLQALRVGNLQAQNFLERFQPGVQQTIIGHFKGEFEKNIFSYSPPHLCRYLAQNNGILKSEEHANQLWDLLKSRFEANMRASFPQLTPAQLQRTLNSDKLSEVLDQSIAQFLQNAETVIPDEIKDLMSFTCNIPRLVSELSTEEAELNKRVVGGCGLRLEPLSVEPSKKAVDILEGYWEKISALHPENWLAVKSGDEGEAKEALFGLLLEDVPADVTDNYQWMKSLLLVPPHAEGEKIEKFHLAKEGILSGNRDSVKGITAEIAAQTDFDGRSLAHYAAVVPDPFYALTLTQTLFLFKLEDHQGFKPVHYAAMEGCLETLKYLLSQNRADLEAKNKYGATPLLVAIQNGQTAVVRYLLSLQAKPTLLADGYNDLHIALHEGKEEVIAALFEVPAFVQSCMGECSIEGGSPLMLACELDRAGLVRKMIELGADPKVKQRNGTTALSIAILRDCSATLNELLKHTVPTDPDKEIALKFGSLQMITLLDRWLYSYKNSYNDNCLHITIANGNIEAALYFANKVQVGHLVNDANLGRETPTQMALQLGAWQLLNALANKGGQVKTEDLLKMPYDPLFQEVVKKAYYDPAKLQDYLLVAAEAGNHQAISDFLIPKGANLLALKGPSGWTIAHYLAKSDGIFLFRAYGLQTGDLRQPLVQEGHKTLAYIAAEQGSLRVLQFLLQQMKAKGIPLNNHYKDKHLLYGALDKAQVEAAKLIIEQTPDLIHQDLDAQGTYAAHMAAKNGLKVLLEFFYIKGADFKIKDGIGYQPLDYLVRLGEVEQVRHFLAHPYKMEVTPRSLFLAASQSKNELLKILISHSHKTGLLEAALLLAVESANPSATLFLLREGAQVHFTRTDGMSSLLLAAKNGQKDVLELLLEKAEKKEEDLIGNTPLHLAAENGHAACCFRLMQAGYSPMTVNRRNTSPLQLGDKYQGVKKVLSGQAQQYFKEIQDFLEGVKRGNQAYLELALSKLSLDERIYCGEDEAENGKFRTPLQHIVAQCEPDLTKKLFDHLIRKRIGFDPNVPDDKGETLAHYSIVHEVELPPTIRLDWKAKNHKNQTPLQLAAKHSKPDLFLQLLDRATPEEIELTDDEGRTPLFYALLGKRKKNLEALMAKKAKLYHKDYKLITPLFLACQMQEMTLVKVLLGGVIDPNQPATAAYILPLHLAMHQEQPLLARTLLFSGVKCDTPTIGGKRPIHIAAQVGNLGLIGLLAAKGVSFNNADAKGFTPAHAAAASGKLQTLQTLLKVSEIDAEQRMDVDGTEEISLLQAAALGGQPETVDWLLQKFPHQGANQKALSFAAMSPAATTILPHFDPYSISVQPEAICRAIVHALGTDNVDAVKALYERGVSINADILEGHTGLHLAARSGALLSTQWLLQQGADGLHRSSIGETALEISATNDSFEQFKLIIDFVKPSTTYTNSRGESLLHLAAAAGKAGHVLVLLERNYPTELIDSRKYTPLHVAAKKGHAKVAMLLLALGTDSEARSLDQKTALQLVEAEHQETIRVIKQYDELVATASPGSSLWHLAVRGEHLLPLEFLTWVDATYGINQPDHEGITPLHLAASLGKKAFIVHLLRHGADRTLADKKGRRAIDFATDEKTKILLKVG